MGAPISRTRNNRQRALGMLRFYAGMATALHGETIENSLPGEYRLLHAEGAGRRGRRDHPVERPADRVDLEDRPGAGDRLHRGAEAGRGSAADAAAAGASCAWKPACRRAWSTSCRATARPRARRWPAHPDVDKVAFTGSHLTGQKIVQASAGNLKRVSLELGGKSPDIVFADADLDAGGARRRHGGVRQLRPDLQRRHAAVRRAEDLRRVRRPRRRRSARRCGSATARDPETQVGPLVSTEQLERVTGYLAIGRQEGARPLSGGERLTEGDLAKGYFVPPTVFADVRDDMRIAQEEIFGPVISAIPFTDIEEVIERGNETTLRPRQRRVDARRRQGAPAGARRSAPARCGSTATRRWTRRCRSAATR